MKRKFAKRWLLFLRWAFRACGGFHKSEHSEIVWAAEVKAEKEAAELRLQALTGKQRHTSLSRMLNDELQKRGLR